MNDTCSTCLKPYGKKYPLNMLLNDWNKITKNDSTVYSVEINAKEALYLDITFRNLIIPKESSFIISNDKDIFFEFDYKHTLAHEKYKTFTIKGDIAILKFIIPKNIKLSSDFELASIVYIYEDIFDNNTNTLVKALSCHNDINCPDADDYRELGRSVVYIRNLCQDDLDCFQCSGSVVNNEREDHTPYILTANHCINGTISNNLDQAVFVFNHNSDTCGGGALYSYPSFDYELTGSTKRAHLHGLVGSDFALLELFDDIPIQYNVLYAGWDRATGTSLQGDDVIGVHHPGGTFKKISYGEIDNNGSTLIGFVRVEWNDGLVEGGSSGSPLFTEDFRIVGTLSGGPFAGTCSNLGSDYYGHFRDSWDSVWGSSYRLKDWLDPDGEDPDYLGGNIPLSQCPSTRSLSGEYYRTDYNPNNTVTIGASNSLTLTDQTVYNNGKYEFRAGNTITIVSDVEFELGSTVTFITGSCQ